MTDPKKTSQSKKRPNTYLTQFMFGGVVETQLRDFMTAAILTEAEKEFNEVLKNGPKPLLWFVDMVATPAVSRNFADVGRPFITRVRQNGIKHMVVATPIEPVRTVFNAMRIASGMEIEIFATRDLALQHIKQLLPTLGRNIF